jgi:hypothetical protein
VQIREREGAVGAVVVASLLLIALIGVVCIAAVTTLGSHASTTLNQAGTTI